MTYNMRFQDAELVDAWAWKDKNGVWYMKLMYQYQDGNDTRLICFPKVGFPFETSSLPILHEYGVSSFKKEYSIEIRNNYVSVYEGNFKIPGTKAVIQDVCFANVVHEPSNWDNPQQFGAETRKREKTDDI